MASEYRKKSLEKYLNDLASRLPAPGGGSVVALMGALGMGLLSMVSYFTLDKENYRQYEEEIRKILERTHALRTRLTELIDEDVNAYAKVAEAYKLPRSTQQEKEFRRKEIERTYKEALLVPLEVAEYCRDGLEVARRLVEIGNVRLVSDVGIAALLLEAGLKGAELNVKINLAEIRDEEYKAEKNRVINLLLAETAKIKEAVIMETEKKITNL